MAGRPARRNFTRPYPLNGSVFCKFTYLKGLHGHRFPKGDGSYRVLVSVLDYADQHGRNAHPGIARLAKDCVMGESTVRRHLKWLKDNGYIVEESRGHSVGDVRLASKYSLATPDLPLTCERKVETPTAQLEPPAAHLEQAYRSLGADLPLTGERLSDPLSDPSTSHPSTSDPVDAQPVSYPSWPDNLSNRITRTPLEHDSDDEYLEECSNCYWNKRPCGNVRKRELVSVAAEPDWDSLRWRDDDEPPW
jgi:Helix-turn-helix domain